MKNILKLIIISMCVLYGVVIAQSKQPYIKTQQFKVVEQRMSVSVDGEKYATATMTYDEMMQDALKNGNLERSPCSQRADGALKWILQDPNKVMLDVVFEKVIDLDGKEQEPYVANVSIDREKSTVTVSIPEDLVEKKYITPYSRVILLLNDLMLVHQEDGFELEKKEHYVQPEYSDELEVGLEHHRDLYFHCKLIKTALFEKKPRELPRLTGPRPNKMKAILTTRDAGETVAMIDYFDCDRSHLSSCQYEYDLESRMAAKATIVYVNSSMLKNEKDINEIVKKYLNSKNLEDCGVIGSRMVRTVVLEK